MRTRLHASHVALVAAGGTLGTLARFGVAQAWADAAGWPVATFTVNIVGAFALGVLLESLVRRGAEGSTAQRVRLTLGTGFLGAFTTFSALAIEVERMLADGHIANAAAYGLGSVTIGFAACAVGVALSARLHRRRAQLLPTDPDADAVSSDAVSSDAGSSEGGAS